MQLLVGVKRRHFKDSLGLQADGTTLRAQCEWLRAKARRTLRHEYLHKLLYTKYYSSLLALQPRDGLGLSVNM
jgi:hypothetical protein